MGLSIALSSGCKKSDSEQFADNYCAEVAKCCSQASLPGDGKACHELMTLEADFGSYNSQAGDACLAEVRSQVSAGTFCANLSSSSQSACDSVFGSSSGNKKPGEDCNADSDCASSSSGQVTCAYSSVNNNSGTCVALNPVGKACLISSDCVSTAYCNHPQYICTPQVNAGGDCTGTNDSECVDSAYCDTDAKQCKAKLANGATCTSSTACESDDCSSGKCQSNTAGLSFFCGS